MRSPSGVASALRMTNRSRVMRAIFRHRTSSRTALTERTNLTPPSVTRIVRELVGLNLVIDGEERTARGGPGRRRTEVRIDPTGAYVLGIVLNASGKSVALAGADGHIIAEERVSDKDRRSPVATLKSLAAAARRLCARHLSNKHRLLGATVACAGEVDFERQHLIDSMALGWQDVAVGRELGAMLGIPIHVDNLNMSMLEATQMSDHKHLVADAILVRVANGIIGGAMMQGGRMLRSPNTRPSWMGHHPVRGGRKRCFCGEIGCLNTVASAPAMLSASAREKSPARFSATDFVKTETAIRRLIKSADQGDKQAIAVLRAGGEQLGRFLVAHAGSLGPSLIHVSGFVGRSQHYFAGVQRGFAAKAPASLQSTTRLVANDMSVVQAAVNVSLDRFVYSTLLNVDQLTQAKDNETIDARTMNAA